MGNRDLEKLLKNIVVLVDSREKSNKHILDYFEKQGIKYKIFTLKYGDYSCILNDQDLKLDFREVVSIERKNSLDELVGNLTRYRERFEKEFSRSKGKMYLMVEGASYSDILNHNYKSAMYPKALLGSIKSFEVRYSLNSNFIKKCEAGNFIYWTLRAYVREYLKNKDSEVKVVGNNDRKSTSSQKNIKRV